MLISRIKHLPPLNWSRCYKRPSSGKYGWGEGHGGVKAHRGCDFAVYFLPVKQTGHLKVPPIPSKLCSIRWHWSLAGESKVWLQSLHSWFSPSSVEENTWQRRWNPPCLRQAKDTSHCKLLLSENINMELCIAIPPRTCLIPKHVVVGRVPDYLAFLLSL